MELGKRERDSQPERQGVCSWWSSQCSIEHDCSHILTWISDEDGHVQVFWMNWDGSECCCTRMLNENTPPMREGEWKDEENERTEESTAYLCTCTPHIWKHFENASKATKHYQKWQKAEFLDKYEWSIYVTVVTEIIKWSLILIAELKPIILISHNPVNSYHVKT